MSDAEALAFIDAALASQATLATYVLEKLDAPAMAERIINDDFHLFIPKDAQEAFADWEADQDG